METIGIIGLYRNYIETMEKKMETIGIIVVFIGITWYILGLYRDNGKENGNYYLGSRVRV